MLKFVETDCSQQEIPALETDQLGGEGDFFFSFEVTI